MAQKNKDQFEAIVELELKYPFNKSQETAIELANIWGMRIIKLSTYDDHITLGIPIAKFQSIFDEKPKPGTYDVPQGTQHFIEKVKVKKINILQGD